MHHIRDGGLAKLGGATPANTIVGQLSKGTRAFLLPSQRSPREKERAPLAPTARGLPIIPTQPLAFVADANFSSCVRRRTRCARVRQKLPRPLASRFFARARARARTPPRLLSARVPAIQEPRTPRFEQRVRPPWPPRARALSRVELTSPRSSTPSRRRGRSRELRLRAHGIPGTRFPPTPFSNPARFPKTNQPRRRGRVASRRFPRRARATRGGAGADARDRVARNPPYLSRHLFERHLTDSGRLSSRRAPHASASTRPTRRCPGAAARPLPPGLRRGGAGHARVRPQGGERRGPALRRSGVGGRRKRDDHVRGGTSRDRSRILKRSPRSFRALENGRARLRLSRRKPFVRDDERSF